MLYAEAVVEALRRSVEGDDRVHLMGQYFLGLPPYRTMVGDLYRQYPDRVYFPPLAELGAGASSTVPPPASPSRPSPRA